MSFSIFRIAICNISYFDITLYQFQGSINTKGAQISSTLLGVPFFTVILLQPLGRFRSELVLPLFSELP